MRPRFHLSGLYAAYPMLDARNDNDVHAPGSHGHLGRHLPAALLHGTVLLLAGALLAFSPLPNEWGAAVVMTLAILSLRVKPARPPALPVSAPVAEPRPGSASEADRAPLWRQMLDAVADPALVLDAQSEVIAANATALSMFPAAVGRHIALVHRSPEMLDAVGQTERLQVPQSFEMQMLVPIERRLAGMATPLTPQPLDGAGPTLLIVLRDLTEAERLSQMRADFVANASHELRTPLAALKGFVETLQGAARDDAAAREQFLAIMQTEAARMSRLIDDLLSLSRVEMREHVAPTGKVDLNELTGTVVRGLRPLADTAGITLTLSPLPGKAVVTGDFDDLMQVAQNLVQNAIKYGKRGGKVDVCLREEGQRIQLVVADDGIGIPPEHLPRLTERFYRVSAKDSRARGGTGLGLAIVKHIVRRHRGELRIESSPGAGSTFTVLVPASPEARRAIAKQ